METHLNGFSIFDVNLVAPGPSIQATPQLLLRKNLGNANLRSQVKRIPDSVDFWEAKLSGFPGKTRNKLPIHILLHISPKTIESWMNREHLRNTDVRSQVKGIPDSNSGEYVNGEAHWFLRWRQKQASHPHSSSQCSKFEGLISSFNCHEIQFISNMLRKIGTLPQGTITNPTQNTSMSTPPKMLLQENLRNSNVESQVMWNPDPNSGGLF